MTAGIFGSVFVVLAVVIIVLISTLGSSPPTKGQASIATSPAPASIVNAVAHVPASELAAAGSGGGQTTFVGSVGSAPVVAIKHGAPLTSNGKPEIAYVGAGFCPYCAATRWALAIALSKFGTLQGLKISASSPDDFAPNTHTLSFDGVTYTSQYLSFSETEQVSNVCKATSANPSPPPANLCSGGYTPLQTVPVAIEKLLSTYDTSKYFGSADASGPGIPFIDMGGRWVESGAPYPSTATNFPPVSMAGLNWQQIVNTFTVPTQGVGQAILGAANHYIAAFCELTHDKPAAVCSLGIVKTLQAAGLK